MSVSRCYFKAIRMSVIVFSKGRDWGKKHKCVVAAELLAIAVDVDGNTGSSKATTLNWLQNCDV